MRARKQPRGSICAHAERKSRAGNHGTRRANPSHTGKERASNAQCNAGAEEAKGERAKTEEAKEETKEKSTENRSETNEKGLSFFLRF